MAWLLWDGSDRATHSAAAADTLPPSGQHGGVASGAGGPDFNPAHVQGQELCVDCHRSEVAVWNNQWQESGHGWAGFRLLTGSTAESYAEALGISAEDIKTNSLCVKCHATPRLGHTGDVQPVIGVTCEACHNPSGGDDGWLNAHAVYGPPGTGRTGESFDHFQQRMARCTTAGQLRSVNLYDLASRCYACHIVGSPQLVEANHEALGDEFDNLLEGFMHEKVRHNFHLDQRANEDVSSLWVQSHVHPGRTTDSRKRMIYVVGELARLETLLRHITTHFDPENESDFVYDMAEALEVDENLEVALANVQPAAMEALQRALGGAVQAVAEDEEVKEGEGWLVDSMEVLVDAEYGDLPGDPRPAYNALADAMRDLAMEIAAGDGTELADLDLDDL
jgi:hypothetical protein